MSDIVQEPISTRVLIAALLDRYPEITNSEIARQIGVSRQNIHRIRAAIARAENAGKKPPRKKRVVAGPVMRPTMSADQFEECLFNLGWSHRWLGDYLSRSRDLVDRWASGDIVVPENVAAWLDVRLRQAAVYALPDGWRLLPVEYPPPAARRCVN